MSGIDDVQAVLSLYALNPSAVRQIEPLGSAGGWSGSRLWRVTAADRRGLCLRRWPQSHPTLVGLRLIHAVVGSVAPQLPIVACPLRSVGGATFVEHVAHRWELTSWLPGKADYHVHPSRARLHAAMHTLARFHELASRYERRRDIPPAIADRRWQWSMRSAGLSRIERSLQTPLSAVFDRRANRLLALARKVIETSDIIRRIHATQELWLQPAIRDIHHDHVLFIGDEVTGLIDFGAMRIDTPLTDIARLVGSLVGDDREARQSAFDAYSEIRPLGQDDRRLIDLLDESGLVIGALNWLIWLYVERRDMGPAEPIIRRLDEILKRLESRAQ
jgi:Ser/Thr protein kinase RdoA (MazF antagonist)